MIEEVNTTVYKTSDGKVFEKKEEAEKHQRILRNVKAFKVFAYPDLTEGRGDISFQGYLLVHAGGAHEMFVEEWCYGKYGNKIVFVQGVRSVNTMRKNWRFYECDVDVVEEKATLGKLEDNFVDKLWS